jgi:hypothetical protein
MQRSRSPYKTELSILSAGTLQMCLKLPGSYSPEFDAALVAYYEAVAEHDAAVRSGVRARIVAAEDVRRLAVLALRPPGTFTSTPSPFASPSELHVEPSVALAVHCDYCGTAEVPRVNGRCQNCGSHLVDQEPKQARSDR